MIVLSRKRAWNSNVKQAQIPFPRYVDDEMKALCKSNVTVVAYHTNDPFYTHEAKRLYASAVRLNINIEITVIDSYGDWIKNTSFKSSFLEKKRKEIRGPILYIDVDAIFHRSPLESLVNLECDIAVCHHLKDGHLMSGTLFLQDTPMAMDLMNKWSKSCKERVDVWDQKVLQDLLIVDKALKKPNYQIVNLPIEYCWIFDSVCTLNQNVEKIYIEHLQASRSIKEEERLKNKFCWLSIRKKSVQRRIDRVTEVEKILFSKSY